VLPEPVDDDVEEEQADALGSTPSTTASSTHSPLAIP
jgi:hypothetical protein